MKHTKRMLKGVLSTFTTSTNLDHKCMMSFISGFTYNITPPYKHSICLVGPGARMCICSATKFKLIPSLCTHIYTHTCYERYSPWGLN